MAKKITITEEQLKRLISTNTINERHTYAPTEGDETYAEEEEKEEVEEEVAETEETPEDEVVKEAVQKIKDTYKRFL
jgi:hypothetical protein